MKRLIKKSSKEYKTKKELEEPISEKNDDTEDVSENKQLIPEPEGVEPFTDMVREDPYLGKYVEITNQRSKYFGYHAKVDDKFFSDRYRIYLEPKNYDDTGEKDYIINYVGIDAAPRWFTVIE